jgi:hypothetical protein
MRLKKGETIITAYAEPAAGPGWANQPIWVILRDGNGKITEECIQPEDQTIDMAILYTVCAAAHRAMSVAVEKSTRRRAKEGKG